jgi:hypothetical protein
MADIKTVQGTQIQSVSQHYENLGIRLANGEYIYMTYAQLLVILNEFDFTAEKKRTRTWLTLDINDWRVERFDEPRTY